MGTRTLFIKTLGIGVAIVMFACASAYADDGILTWPVETKGQEVALGFEVTGTVAAESGDGGQVVELTGFASGGAPGSPMLPTKTLSFLVPPDADPDTVAAVLEDASWELVPGSFDLAPAPPAATLGDSGPVVAWGDVDPANIRDGRNTELYATDALFPASALGTPAPSMYREWRLVHVDLTPVACNPVTGEVKLLRTGTIRVSYQLGAESSAVKLASGEAKDVGTFWQQVSTTLVNPDDAGSFYPVSATKVGSNSGAGTGMVIITTNNIVTNSTKLASFRTHKATMLSTTVDIITEAASGDASHYTTGASCSQRAANIRSWLKLFYSGWGIQHVLLIGDPHPSTFSSTTSIPMMMCYPQANTTSNSTPTDMCFAELSGNWNVDADSYPGEWGSSTEDFATGGIDFNCEVKVGRIPYYGTIADLDSILQKIITYETATGDQSWRQKLLAPAAVSNFVEDRDNDGVVDTTPATMGDSWGEALKTLATTNSFSAYTLYEKTGCKSDGTAYPLTACNVALTQANIQSEWLNHYGFVTWWGHGSSTGASRVCWTSDTVRADNICQVNTSESTWYNMWNSSNCSALNDSYPSYVVQVSCNNGWPENTGNLGYSLLKNGAIGTVSASRVSWYAVANWYTGLYSSCGDNASYGYRIFERMSGSSEDVGTALNWCRGNFGTAWGYNSWMNKLDFNLYGDPSTSFATQTPGITVTAPTSASSWKAGTTQGVTWTATGVTGNVYIILYNGWTQERVLATVPASSGSYGWAIPFGQTPDTDYRIRVKSVSTPSLDDYSDAFAITQSPLRLTSPTAASSWNAGAPQTVSWATDGTLVGDVYICLFRGWAYQRTLKMTPVSSGSWTWNVPSYELVGTDYRIRLKSALSPAVQDFSDQFSINQARIAVTAPGPSALWEAGAPHSITWTTDGTITGNVYICLYDGWTRVRTLAMTTAASGSWTWNIPSHETVKANYHIRVKSASEPTVRDFSGTFAIAQPKIQITAPTGGPSWTAGTPQDITWNTDGSIGGNVYICLYSNWTHQRTLATVPAADGTWSWSIPSGETPGTTYRIRVKSVDQPTIRDYTDLFTVASP